MIWAIIIIAITVLDQLVKYVIIENIELGTLVPVIDGFFYLTYLQNTGAAWSILQNGRIFFVIITPVIAAVIIYFMRKVDHRLLRLALSFVLGGALGNYIDRLIKGNVTDFLEFHFGTYHFPTFNVADSFVVIGTFLLAYYMLFVYKEPAKTDNIE